MRAKFNVTVMLMLLFVSDLLKKIIEIYMDTKFDVENPKIYKLQECCIHYEINLYNNFLFLGTTTMFDTYKVLKNS